MNTSTNITHSRNRGRHRQRRVWSVILAGILLVCLIGAAIVPLTVRAAENVAAAGESVTDELSITQNELEENETAPEAPVAEEPVEIVEDPVEEEPAEIVEDPAEEEPAEIVEDPAAEESAELEADELPVEETAEEEIAETVEEELEDESAIDMLASNGDVITRVYGVDYFDARYSSGYLCLSGGIPSGMSTPGDGEYKTSHGTPYKFANTKRSTGISMTYYNGACMNGVYYDVREYLWIDSANTNCAYVTVIGYTSGSSKNYGSGNTGVYRELHFYKAGTLRSGNPEEVTFRGVLRFRDCDSGEGYNIVQGLQNIWLYPTTNIRRAGTTTWMGTETGEGESEVTTNCFWATVEGTPEEPLTICYVDLGGRSSQINYSGNSIRYNIIPDGVNPLPTGVQTSAAYGCATYSYYHLIDAEEYDYYEFDGWYYDKELTRKVTYSETDGNGEYGIKVSEDQTFYGTYHRSAVRIDTEVVGGEITDSIDHIRIGEDAAIAYQPFEGYVLDSVTVDGENVDPDLYEEEYIFTDLQEDHRISVVYVEAEAPVKAVSKGGASVENEILSDGDEVRYSITFRNPTSQARDMVVYDEVDERLRICKAEDGGSVEGQRITWTLEDVPAGGEMTVHFRAAVIGQRTEQEIGNIAYLEMGGSDPLPSNEVVVVVAPVPEPVVPTESNTHTTREETETIRTIHHETVTQVQVPVAVPTVVPVTEETPVVEQPVVSAIVAATGDESQMWLYLAAAGSAALVLGAWFVHHARRMRM